MSKDIEIKEGKFTKKEEISKKKSETKDINRNTTTGNTQKNSIVSNESGTGEYKEKEEESLKEENRFCDEAECMKADRKKYENCNFRINIKKSVDNNSGKLRTQLKNYGSGEDKKDFEEMLNGGYPIAAHHIISGNQVFKNLSEIAKLTLGVGYDINCAENGIFLPSNQTNFGLEKGEIATGTHKAVEAFDAMNELGLQWHSGTHEYTIEKDIVEKNPELEKIKNYAEVITKYVTSKFAVNRYRKKCREVETEKEKIIEKMNRISSDIKNQLMDFKNNPKNSSPYFVSRLVVSYTYGIPETVKVIIMKLKENTIYAKKYRVNKSKNGHELIFNERENMSFHIENIDELFELSKYCSNICYFILLGEQSKTIEKFLLDEDFKLIIESSEDRIDKIIEDNQKEIKVFLKENIFESGYIKGTVIKRKNKVKINFGVKTEE